MLNIKRTRRALIKLIIAFKIRFFSFCSSKLPQNDQTCTAVFYFFYKSEHLKQSPLPNRGTDSVNQITDLLTQ